MLVRVFHAGRSNGQSPVNYLLADRDHTGEARSCAPEVLEGHPGTTISVINAISRKHKYVSGVLAFRAGEDPTRTQMHEVIRSFKETVAPGLRDDQVNSLFVLHRDKRRTEIHFVLPMVELTTGKRWNAFVPGQKNLALYEAFQAVTNHQLGYSQVVADPLRAAVASSMRKRPGQLAGAKGKRLLTAEIARQVRNGRLSDRGELCAFLENELGVPVTRQGPDYLSLRLPGAARAVRFRGPLFEANANYGSLRAATNQMQGPVLLTGPEFKVVQRQLSALVDERRKFNDAAYRRPAAPSVRRPYLKTTTQERTMTKKHTTKAIDDALTAGRLSDSSRPVSKVNSSPAVLKNISATRSKASASTGGGPAPSAAMGAMRSIQLAIANLQGSIDAAVADVAASKTPEDSRRAQERVASLMQQMMRLAQQLREAQQRQINEPQSAPKFKR